MIELRVNPEQITTRQTIAQLRAGKAPPKPARETEARGGAEASETGARARPAPASRGVERRGACEYRLSAQFRIDAAGRLLRDDAQSSDNAQPSSRRRRRHYPCPRLRGGGNASVRRDPCAPAAPFRRTASARRAASGLRSSRPRRWTICAGQSRSARTSRNCSSTSAMRCWRCSVIDEAADGVSSFALTLRPGDVDVLNNLGNALSGALQL